VIDDWEQADVDEMASKIAKKGAKPVNGKGGRADEEEEKHEEVKSVAKNGPKEI